MTNPLISIVICCHNRANLLPSTMQSVFEQRYRPVEIVVVDDGSTDGTRELMSQYGDKIRYYWHENKGVAKTRTIGCKYANGEYIAFLDDDDLMPPDRIEILFDALSISQSAVFSVGDWMEIDANDQLTGKRWLPEGMLSNSSPVILENGFEAVLWPKIPAAPHTTLFRKSVGQQIGWFDERFVSTSEDKDFYARLSLIGPVIYIPGVVSYYRRGHDSLTSSRYKLPTDKVELFIKHLPMSAEISKNLHKRLRLRLLNILKNINKDKYLLKLDQSNQDRYVEIEKTILKLQNLSSVLNYLFFKKILMPFKQKLHKLKHAV